MKLHSGIRRFVNPTPTIRRLVGVDLTDYSSIAWGYSSVVEHSTADREVSGSYSGAPPPPNL